MTHWCVTSAVGLHAYIWDKGRVTIPLSSKKKLGKGGRGGVANSQEGLNSPKICTLNEKFKALKWKLFQIGRKSQKIMCLICMRAKPRPPKFWNNWRHWPSYREAGCSRKTANKVVLQPAGCKYCILLWHKGGLLNV